MLMVEIFTWFENIELHPLNRHAFLWKVHPILPQAKHLAKENNPPEDTSAYAILNLSNLTKCTKSNNLFSN